MTSPRGCGGSWRRTWPAAGSGTGTPAGGCATWRPGCWRALAARGGGAAGVQLSADEPRLRTQLVYAAGKSYGGPANITSRVLILIAAEGRMVRGHRRGGWTSGQFEWFLPEAWLERHGAGRHGPGRWPRRRAGRRHRADGTGAALAGRLRARAGRRPAMVGGVDGRADQGGARRAADRRGRPSAGRPGSRWPTTLTSRRATSRPAGPPVAALLPALDPAPMGWQARSWYPRPARARPRSSTRTGNVGPTVWWAGRVVGGWAQRAAGEVVVPAA